jgi:hypothetical protein
MKKLQGIIAHRRYSRETFDRSLRIKGGKLADNVFKKEGCIPIAIELQPAYISLNVSPACNLIITPE